MNSAIERLLTLRVADVMTTNVVQIPIHGTMGEAAKLFAKHGITGAPVVDEQGRCVGVISGSDFVARERVQETAEKAPASNVEQVLVQDAPGGPYHIEEMSEDLVSAHMTTDVKTVTESTTLIEASRAMCGVHIHRLIVLGDRERPKGVITALDVIAAVVKAIEE